MRLVVVPLVSAVRHLKTSLLLHSVGLCTNEENFKGNLDLKQFCFTY